MIKDGVCTSAYFVEVRRWFNEKMTKWMKVCKSTDPDDVQSWTDLLNDSHVYCREEDENGKITGNWFRIVGIEDHGDNVTLRICKPNGKIEL